MNEAERKQAEAEIAKLRLILEWELGRVGISLNRIEGKSKVYYIGLMRAMSEAYKCGMNESIEINLK